MLCWSRPSRRERVGMIPENQHDDDEDDIEDDEKDEYWYWYQGWWKKWWWRRRWCWRWLGCQLSELVSVIANLEPNKLGSSPIVAAEKYFLQKCRFSHWRNASVAFSRPKICEFIISLNTIGNQISRVATAKHCCTELCPASQLFELWHNCVWEHTAGTIVSGTSGNNCVWSKRQLTTTPGTKDFRHPHRHLWKHRPHHLILQTWNVEGGCIKPPICLKIRHHCFIFSTSSVKSCQNSFWSPGTWLRSDPSASSYIILIICQNQCQNMGWGGE